MPIGITISKSGLLYIADRQNNMIRTVNSTTGLVSTLTGTVEFGDRDGPLSRASFYNPTSICVSSTGVLYVADYINSVIRAVGDSNVWTVAGSMQVTGSNDGQGLEAKLNLPSGVAIDGNDNVYISDSYNNLIRFAVIFLVIHV